jgi:hypothetical protein
MRSLVAADTSAVIAGCRGDGVVDQDGGILLAAAVVLIALPVARARR